MNENLCRCGLELEVETTEISVYFDNETVLLGGRHKLFGKTYLVCPLAKGLIGKLQGNTRDTQMNHIPKALNDEMNEDPFYKLCAFHRTNHGPMVRIERHHNLIFAGRQVQERWAILPICQPIHEKANETHIRERLDWIMLNRATNDQVRQYSKVINWQFRKQQLNQQFGRYQSYENKKNKAVLPADAKKDIPAA